MSLLPDCDGCGKPTETLCFLDADEVGPARTRCPRCRDAELDLARTRRVAADDARRRARTVLEDRRTAFLTAGVVLLALLAFVLVLWIGGSWR